MVSVCIAVVAVDYRDNAWCYLPPRVKLAIYLLRRSRRLHACIFQQYFQYRTVLVLFLLLCFPAPLLEPCPTPDKLAVLPTYLFRVSVATTITDILRIFIYVLVFLFQQIKCFFEQASTYQYSLLNVSYNMNSTNLKKKQSCLHDASMHSVKTRD